MSDNAWASVVLAALLIGAGAGWGALISVAAAVAIVVWLEGE